MKMSIFFAGEQDPEEGGVRVLETRYDFDGKSRLASAKFDYIYTKNLIHPMLKGRIGGKMLPLYFVHHGWSTEIGQKSSKSGQFLIHPHNLNVTSVTDGVATFTFGANFDVLMVQGKNNEKIIFGHKSLCLKNLLFRIVG